MGVQCYTKVCIHNKNHVEDFVLNLKTMNGHDIYRNHFNRIFFFLFLSIKLFLPSFRDIGVEVRDFGPSWRDGVAFLALIDSIKSNLINLAEMRKSSMTNKQRLNTAFDVAESKLGIARLLDADDVDVPKPEEKSIMTYVAQFLHKYPEPKVGDDPFSHLSSLFFS